MDLIRLLFLKEKKIGFDSPVMTVHYYFCSFLEMFEKTSDCTSHVTVPLQSELIM